jgi:hypothetical protein
LKDKPPTTPLSFPNFGKVQKGLAMKQLDPRLEPGQYKYQIVVYGNLDKKWSEWFSGMEISAQGGITKLSGVMVDQVRLRGVLSKLWDLNLIVISVKRMALQENQNDSEQGDKTIWENY